MQVIATSIQDLARETSRQNQELWQAIRKRPPAPRGDNQPPSRGENGSNDQEANSHQVTRRRDGEVERTPPRSRHRAESAGSSAPPIQHKTTKTTRSSKQPEKPDRSSKQSERPDKSFKQPERQDRRDSSSRQPDRSARSSRDPDDKTARLEKELREMRKQMRDMKNSLRAKAARNLDNLVHRADSPFIPSIADFPLPSRFKVPLLENFDGTKDPFDYLEAFKTIMQLQAVPEELSRAFIDHFIGSQRRGRPPTHLLSVKQMEGESLRAFVHRFNEEAMKIDRPKEDVTVTAFMAGLRKGDFLYDLCKDPLEPMSELMYEATKHMNAEDDLEAIDDPPPKRRKDTEDRKPELAKQKVPKFTETPERKRTTAPPVKFSSFTPLNTPIDKLLLQIQDDPSLVARSMSVVQQTPVQQSLQHKRNRLSTTGRDPLEKLEPSLEDRRPEEPHELQGKHMHDRCTISWSSNDHPKTSASMIRLYLTAKRTLGRQTTPHGFHHKASNAMEVPLRGIRPMDAPLVGFTGDKVCPNGIVTLPITVGTHPKTVSKTVDFLVVNCPSAYNAIIGRPTLNRLRAVTSTYHLLLKFPTEHGIGEVRGDQVAARECYLASLGPEGQNQTMTIEEQKILVKPSEELDTIELEDGHPERTTKIGANLPPKMKESLVQFLKNNKDVFAWSHEDMPGINPSIISHKLNVDPSLRPVKQKRRVFAPERNNAIMEEVDKLLAANFIREVFYPDWLANVVMVKKNTGKWRMCVDFTDLNRACLKDSFPLPRIDQLVDSTAGHKLLTFMDAFSGYNQIVMDEGDQDKTSFIMSRGLFCYKVMPFGLKNAGATYQRLMNRMFHDQIGRNVEVYVDDMLVKSKEEDGHLDDLRETFETLRKYQMKLNPKRHRSKPRQNQGDFRNAATKEVQRLTGRVAALNWFMSRSTDKCLPFFKTLKKAFEWTDECQQAFEELKKYLTEPLLLSPSKQGEELYLYLAVSPTVRGRGKIPTYGKASICPGDGSKETSPILPSPHDSIAHQPPTAEGNEQTRCSWATHPVNSPRKMTSQQKTSSKASKWTVNIDGSSTKDSGGVGIVLKSPEGDTIKQAVRLQYPTTNNEAEYEALLAGLKTAKILGATELDVRSDSQLVVGQVNGDYEAKEGCMQQYLQLVRHQMGQFQEVKLSRIPREQNKETDQLAKQALSSSSDDKIKIVQQSSLQATEMNPVHTETFWMTLIISYLQRGTLPDNRHEARRLKVRASRFLMLQGVLYKRGFSLPYLRCLAPDEAKYVMREIHEVPTVRQSTTLTPGSASTNDGTLAVRAMGIRYHGTIPNWKTPAQVSGRLRIDYFTKWVEAEPLATITEKNIQNFVWKAVICRFGIPRVLVSDNGKQFDNPRFRQFSQELGIHNHYSCPGHPQANGQVEVTNRSLLKLIKTRLEGAKGLWPEELPSILWAYRTTVRIPTGETLFRMTFGSEAVVPVEIGLTTLRTSAYDS
uniref:Uncharacterized protein n=1 Tax=Fagus sylvatica TaxID=28930 RepID=A0A2N9G7Y6_FAGSY